MLLPVHPLAVATSHHSLVALPQRLPLLADGLTLLDGAKGQPRHRHWGLIRKQGY